MTIAFDQEAPPLRVDETGTVRVGSSRVAVEVVLGAFNLGHSAERIAADYPAVSLADVYATIGYYLRHQEQLDAYLEHRRQQADELRRDIENQPGYEQWRENLAARLKLRAAERGLQR